MPRFRMRNIKALFILNIEKMSFFKIRSKCITFVGIDHLYWVLLYHYLYYTGLSYIIICAVRVISFICDVL